MLGNEGSFVDVTSADGVATVFVDPLRFVLPDMADLNDATVLDAGCGSASVGIELAKEGNTVFGVDIDENSLLQAKHRAELSGVSARLHLIRESTENLPIRPEAVDCFMSKSTMQYVDRELALAEAQRVLRGSGLLVLIENLPRSPAVLLARSARRLAQRKRGNADYVDSITGYLSLEDIDQLGTGLSSPTYRTYHLLRVPSLILHMRYPGRGALATIDSYVARADRWLLARIPSLQRLSWIVAFKATKQPSPDKTEVAS